MIAIFSGSSLFCVGKELFCQIQLSCDEVNHIDEGPFVSISPCLRFRRALGHVRTHPLPMVVKANES